MHRTDRLVSCSRARSGLKIFAGLLLAASGAAAVPGRAEAQPSPLPTGGPGGGEEEPTKPKGIAEAAPKPTGLMATTLTLPPPRDRRKKFQVISLDGYLRTRGDWFKHLHLGFNDDPDEGGAPFPPTQSCIDAGLGADTCKDTFKTSNLRLRLEPTIQLSETVTVHTQLDLLDNIVLGSTPAGVYRDGTSGSGTTPLGAFSGGQTTPEAASNGLAQSIAVRRAWAEVSTALGFIKFGRMPDHFGLGMVANSGRRADTDYATWETMWRPGALANIGGDNPTGYDLDSDYGDTVDRVMFSTGVPGTNLEAAAALDWPGSGLTSNDTELGLHRVGGQSYDLDDTDDVGEWMLAIARMDAPRDFDDKMDRGKLALNYGARLLKRTQSYDYEKAFTSGMTPEADGTVPRDLSLYSPDLWVKAGFKKWKLELELAGSVGSVRTQADFDTTPVTLGTKVDIRTWGGVLRASTLAVDDKLAWGVELGAASGDQWDNDPQGRTNLRDAQLLPPKGSTDPIKRFVFDPDYKIDLILFRQLIGAVSNAAYVRPHISYKLTKAITASGQNVTSAPVERVATPGNGGLWGTEFDFDLAYQGNGFTIGGAYGVLFPLSAMNHPADLIKADSSGEVFENNTGDAGTAHTVQLRLSVEF
ncbi:MAG TPA: TIGR04551 family protein [Kofleriaceae bacterium]|nr:TIGR04551 family protein [Kofleriaceae bacterium]